MLRQVETLSPTPFFKVFSSHHCGRTGATPKRQHLYGHAAVRFLRLLSTHDKARDCRKKQTVSIGLL